VLRPEPVEAKGREQADDAPRDALRDFCERVVLAWLRRRRGVEPASQAGEMSLTGQSANLFRVQAERLGIPQPEDAPIPEESWQDRHSRVVITPHDIKWSAFDTIRSPRS
jgi:hypothetical protein